MLMRSSMQLKFWHFCTPSSRILLRCSLMLSSYSRAPFILLDEWIKEKLSLPNDGGVRRYLLLILTLRNESWELVSGLVEKLKRLTMHCKLLFHSLVSLNGNVTFGLEVLQLRFEVLVEWVWWHTGPLGLVSLTHLVVWSFLIVKDFVHDWDLTNAWISDCS